MTYQPRTPRTSRTPRDSYGDSFEERGAERSARLPEQIYMRRRVAALVIVLAVVALLVWALTSFARSGSSENEPSTTALPTTLVTTPTEPDPGAVEETTEATATETEKKDEDFDPTATREHPDDEELAAKKTCELSDLQLTIQANKTSFDINDPKDQPELNVQVKNPTGADCVIDANDDKLRFEVYSIAREGFQPVWGDTDCYDPVINGEQTFAAGESRNFRATWSRLASAPGQCSNRQAVPEGAYVVTATLGDNHAEGVTFNIR
ncbi:hypothetical protein QP968_04240 [Corynebacterium sp. MSK041]|uniref:hypothetical protein n=1 Tax=Corynebacterium sp. MSK041 TaxID=3050194 RepID=UPI00254C0C29|nr:hypothetical protein [Corynebacterium sp. MSK041]MDK8794916.1 hypothetical protein [Corynebacterium sp. MSK041]